MARMHLLILHLLVWLAVSSSAIAATQLGNIISPSVSPKALLAFSVGGRAHGSGGIVMQGTTTFVLVTDSNRRVLSASEVSLALTSDGGLCVIHRTTCFSVDVEPKFVKPMILWVLQGTETAFSNTEGRAEPTRKMRSEGLVERRIRGHFIAPQLNTSELFDLLKAADYSQRQGVVESLPNQIKNDIIKRFNRRISSSTDARPVAHRTWTNADYNTKYTTTLRHEKASTIGRPLRYYWTQYQGLEELKITDIAIFRDPTTSADPVVQTIGRLYQVAAILRSISSSNPAKLKNVLDN